MSEWNKKINKRKSSNKFTEKFVDYYMLFTDENNINLNEKIPIAGVLSNDEFVGLLAPSARDIHIDYCLVCLEGNYCGSLEII